MGYRTRAKSLSSGDVKKVSKKPKLPTLKETKALMISQLKSQVKQKTKCKSDGDMFEGLEGGTEEPQAEIKLQVDEHQLLSKIKDEIQAWVIPEVRQKRSKLSQVTKRNY